MSVAFDCSAASRRLSCLAATSTVAFSSLIGVRIRGSLCVASTVCALNAVEKAVEVAVAVAGSGGSGESRWQQS